MHARKKDKKSGKLAKQEKAAQAELRALAQQLKSKECAGEFKNALSYRDALNSGESVDIKVPLASLDRLKTLYARAIALHEALNIPTTPFYTTNYATILGNLASCYFDLAGAPGVTLEEQIAYMMRLSATLNRP